MRDAWRPHGSPSQNRPEKTRAADATNYTDAQPLPVTRLYTTGHHIPTDHGSLCVSRRYHPEPIPHFRLSSSVQHSQIPTYSHICDHMAEPIESLTQQLIDIHRTIDPFSFAILTRVASSFFFGNLGPTLDGILPATITVSGRVTNGIGETSVLKMWEWMYYRANVMSPTTFPTF